MTCISTEFSSQFGFKTTRGIVAQLFLKILKLVCFKKCVSVKLTEANHYCFGYKRFRQSNKNESFPKKKKNSPLRSIPKAYTVADIYPKILMPISKFSQQLIFVTTKYCYLITTVKIFPTHFSVKMLNI